jgi:hypothetical protein
LATVPISCLQLAPLPAATEVMRPPLRMLIHPPTTLPLSLIRRSEWESWKQPLSWGANPSAMFVHHITMCAGALTDV